MCIGCVYYDYYFGECFYDDLCSNDFASDSVSDALSDALSLDGLAPSMQTECVSMETRDGRQGIHLQNVFYDIAGRCSWKIAQIDT